MWKGADQQQELRSAFEVFDKDGNGYLTVDELKKVLSTYAEKLSDDELKEFLKDCNIATDGTINYEGKQFS